MKRRRLGLAKFRNISVKFGQAVKWHAMVNMMNVVIANIGREPRHYRVGFQIARRFERRAFKGPASIVLENNAGKIVLRVKEVRAQGAGN